MLMSFETPRLSIKILNKEAANLVLSFYEENKVIFEPWEPKRSENFYTLSYQKSSLSMEYHQMLEGKLLRYWVFLKDNPDEIIGSFCFQNFLRGPYQSCCLGYKFGQKHQHLGYAYESIQKGIEVLFEECNIHRIEAFIMPNNHPSIRLIEKLHFIYEGFSFSYAQINGLWTDHRRYSLIHPNDQNLDHLIKYNSFDI
ncbi:GNAT family N-acetyltransferase [Mobilitalea sibirica]|uniref:GNAT family N-acetyltransferase n=1 Tax=Mobilitalea sibirica TaxID=1462919 RepID=A0A8J7KX00_9FIRM|nr:GNAT family N-acetyltransferase [Mobilitalea sibirica]MBH1941905.1 GNAT family N-acetyltransferase [Mobilitalea sibirica]